MIREEPEEETNESIQGLLNRSFQMKESSTYIHIDNSPDADDAQPTNYPSAFAVLLISCLT